ncbi:septation protein A [Oceanospirillum sp.]|uniref:septation protein A n=1 Tax=Oceanospirillum sp. TaxID=2021254 RepID=UPI003A9422E4
MKLLLDFFPIAIFFGVYHYTKDMILATAVLIPATIIQIAISWFKTRKIEKMHVVTLVLIIVMGGATVLLQDKSFIQWKPTVVNWLFAGAFLGSYVIGKKPLIQRMMESQISLPVVQWNILNAYWIIFFLAMGAINIAVFTFYSEETWVNFKLFGMLGLTLAFIIIQGIWLTRHIKTDDQPVSEENKELP